MRIKHLSIILAAVISFTALPLHPEENEAAEEKSFSFFDIFAYEHPVKKGDDEKKWKLNLGAGYREKQGNTETMNLNYSASLNFDNNITTFKVSILGFYGEYNGEMNENRWNAQGNFDHYLVSRLEFFSFTMSDYNEIIGLEHRSDSGAGLKLIFIRNRFLLVDVSGAPVYQYEKFRERDRDDELRWSVRWRGTIFPFRDDFTLRYYGYYIPMHEDVDNYRLIHDVYLHVKIADPLGIRAGYRREFNTYTPELLASKPDLKKTDETTYIQVTLTL